MAKNTSANIGFEEKLWAAADKMRGSLNPSDYRNILLGLIFLKYISDTFEAQKQKIIETEGEAEAEDKDYYVADNIFWVPKEARWSGIKDNARDANIGKLIDNAMLAIEKNNPKLKGILPNEYGRSSLDKLKLAGVIDIISQIDLVDDDFKKKDLLGRVYEYCLGKFALAEGRDGGEFYTPPSIVKLLVQMIEPYKGRVFDPCCGSGGMFVQSESFVKAHGGRMSDIAIYGQESNNTTWKLCKMNLAIRGIDSNLGAANADSFHNDQHKDLKADFILANPPFNDSDWDGQLLLNDPRWKYGIPPTGNANYAWIQHFIHHLSPTGIAGFVMANGAMAAGHKEGEIRKNMVKAGLVDCIISMPDKLFYNVSIPCSLWFVSRDRYDHKFRNRHDEILFIDARKIGKMVDRRHRELSQDDINLISNTYHNWRNTDGKYEDIKGFCKAAKIEEVEKNGFVLTPGCYVGTEIVEEDDEVFEEKMKRLTAELNQQFEQSKELELRIKNNLNDLGFE